MDLYLVLLRLLHISTGAFWAGTAIYLAAFILPAAKALGPDGGKFMQQLSMTNKLPMVMMIMSTLNILSGILLIWYFSDGFSNDWMGSHMGIALSIGGTLAIISWVIGLTVTKPAVSRMAAIAMDAAAKKQPPTPEQMEQLNKARATMAKATTIIAWLIGITVVMMAVARYI